MKICSFINSFWLIACIFCIVSCDEESDFIVKKKWFANYTNEI